MGFDFLMRAESGCLHAGGPVGVVISLSSSRLPLSCRKQYQEQTAYLQTALLPETYRAGHDMSRPGEPYLKTGEQA
ncbi:hypothetical protein BN2475_520031 [Paraburkholderia ribeironis]|uniref:Uncharacterized protein n=1 Tax=Paraburkholderia ribeironis TaxID=1247936 RepID=A0A1N7SCC5_9BURK|nr:hypothetical protein BN2475_520031 [Paraburkholderia ribeironis]